MFVCLNCEPDTDSLPLLSDFDRFAFGGIVTDQGMCNALMFAVRSNPLTLAISVCMSLWVTINSNKTLIQLEGMIEAEPETATVTFSLKMKTYLKLADWVTILPSFFMIGIGPLTYSTGIPESLGLGTGMILGKDPATAVRWSINFFAPNIELGQFAFRAMMNHLDLLQIVRIFYKDSLGGFEKILKGTYFNNLFLQFSTIPFFILCEICICEPSVDICPGGVLFAPGLSLHIQVTLVLNLSSLTRLP